MPDEEKKGRGAVPAAVRGLRWALFALLLVAASALLLVQPALEGEGRRSTVTGAIAAGVLVVFAIGYAVYRFLLVRAGRFPAGKAFVQVALVLAVVAVVLGVSMERRAAPGPAAPVGLSRALASADPEVRAIAAELARHRPRAEALALVPRLAELLGDPSPEVRRQAHASLVALAGSDAGGVGEGAAERWRAWWRARGGEGGAAR
jgi:hypothetical protein